jgi:hypothetical protein
MEIFVLCSPIAFAVIRVALVGQELGLHRHRVRVTLGIGRFGLFLALAS